MSIGSWVKRLLGLDGREINGRWMSGAEIERLRRQCEFDLRRNQETALRKEREHNQRMKDPFYVALVVLETKHNVDSLLQAINFVGTSGRQEALRPLIALMMNKEYDEQVRVRAALMIGRLLGKSPDTPPAEAILNSWYRSTDGLIKDVEGATAVGLLAATGDEASIEILCKGPFGGHNNLLFAQIEALTRTPDTRCFKRLFDAMMKPNQFGEQICKALEKQLSLHGAAISSDILRLVQVTQNAKKVVIYPHDDVDEVAHYDISLHSLQEAIKEELTRRGENV